MGPSYCATDQHRRAGMADHFLYSQNGPLMSLMHPANVSTQSPLSPHHFFRDGTTPWRFAPQQQGGAESFFASVPDHRGLEVTYTPALDGVGQVCFFPRKARGNTSSERACCGCTAHPARGESLVVAYRCRSRGWLCCGDAVGVGFAPRRSGTRAEDSGQDQDQAPRCSVSPRWLAPMGGLLPAAGFHRERDGSPAALDSSSDRRPLSQSGRYARSLGPACRAGALDVTLTAEARIACISDLAERACRPLGGLHAAFLVHASRQ
jgi:hypothetical protein